MPRREVLRIAVATSLSTLSLTPMTETPKSTAQADTEPSKSTPPSVISDVQRRVQSHAESGTQKHMITPAELGEMLPSRIEARTMQEIREKTGQGCVDGRGIHAVAGVPGGDIGTLLAECAAIEKETGKPLDRQTIRAIMKTRAVIYTHTDDHAEHDLERAATADPELKPYLAMGMESLMARGTGVATLNQKLALLARKNFGCGHFKNMMKDAAAYGVRGNLRKPSLRNHSSCVGKERTSCERY